jgi:hypothetical protein
MDGYSSIILKGDAHTIVKALNKRVYGERWHDNIILDMRGILKKNLLFGLPLMLEEKGTKGSISLLNMLFLAVMLGVG